MMLCCYWIYPTLGVINLTAALWGQSKYPVLLGKIKGSLHSPQDVNFLINETKERNCEVKFRNNHLCLYVMVNEPLWSQYYFYFG